MKTTIELPDDLYRKAKALAALNRCKLENLIEEGLRLVVARPRGHHQRRDLAVLMTRSLGIVDSSVSDLASNPGRLADFGPDNDRH